MSDISALLALQSDDLVIHEIETKLAALAPRIAELDARHKRVADGVERQQGLVSAEEKKQAFLRDKIAEHRQLIERNQAQFDQVTNIRQAAAAAAQMEQAKKIVAGEESDLLALNRRLEEMRGALKASTDELAALEAEQATARGEVAEQRTALEAKLATAAAKRAETAKGVSASLRTRYDRLRNKKRVHVVVALNGTACGACDTAIPMQLRHAMLSTGAIELCEVCGVMMYHQA
jgi:predicted  nucleic acid-binding Zn-ribbon protein